MPRLRGIINRWSWGRLCECSENALLLCVSMSRSLIALTLAFALSLGGTLDVFAASTQHKRKSRKPASPPCRTGCKPETAAPQLPADTPEDEVAQKELSELARGVHNGSPGAYAKLSAFATKNTTGVLGARAALALGYEDYSKNRMAQALGWLLKAQNDSLLREYALYWTAQAQRALGRNADAYKVLQTIQHDYPNTAMREPLLEAFAPTAVQVGHAQEAIDALNAYSATGSKSTLLLERARAYQAAHQLPRAAKDFQTIFYKFPLTDEAKPAGSALSPLMHALSKEYPYPGVELQEQRAQIFYDAHKW
jgi:tetratricopeptide (TPR) repeat protein